MTENLLKELRLVDVDSCGIIQDYLEIKCKGEIYKRFQTKAPMENPEDFSIYARFLGNGHLFVFFFQWALAFDQFLSIDAVGSGFLFDFPSETWKEYNWQPPRNVDSECCHKTTYSWYDNKVQQIHLNPGICCIKISQSQMVMIQHHNAPRKDHIFPLPFLQDKQELFTIDEWNPGRLRITVLSKDNTRLISYLVHGPHVSKEKSISLPQCTIHLLEDDRIEAFLDLKGKYALLITKKILGLRILLLLDTDHLDVQVLSSLPMTDPNQIAFILYHPLLECLLSITKSGYLVRYR